MKARSKLSFAGLCLPLVLAAVILIGSASSLFAQARNNLTMNVTGASDQITGTLTNLRGMNYFDAGDLFTLSINNRGEAGTLYVSVQIGGTIAWFDYDTASNLEVITLKPDQADVSTFNLGRLPQNSTAYVMNFSILPTFNINDPLTFTAFLYNDNDDLIGMASETVFLNPEDASPTRVAGEFYPLP
ncbi:hypothetical protein [Desulfonatronovibrio magnus]|uniref:hypothetical protein n=1 Tax=Desulfonatronovibrio magnus TaxID=698827 RepID=UPI0005EB2F6F|nr:hypothetical protein [Desulfonatronovibrio magnus]